MSNSARLSYPEELKQQFVETKSINYRDGTSVSASEIWEFMTEEAPRRFPYAFDTNTNNRAKLSEDVEFFSGIKRGYLTLTMKDFLIKAHEKGIPLIHVIGGQSMDIYYAAGGIPVRNAHITQSVRDSKEGVTSRGATLISQEILESGKRGLSVDSCDVMLTTRAVIDQKIVPLDMTAPYLCMRCSDMAFLVEAYRGKFPSLSVDCPIVDQENKEWAVDYFATELRKVLKKITDISGKEITDKDVIEEIKLENEGRKLAQDITKSWRSAKIPPTNSTDFFDVPQLANDFRGDPVAAIGVLEEMKEEVNERIKHSVKGIGLVDDPIRLYGCGTGMPTARRIDKAGGVIVGWDEWWNIIDTDVKESGDPYENLARSVLSFPQEQPTEKRAEWVIEQVKQSRADGVAVLYFWGCNYASAAARLMADIIKERTGLPTIIFEVEPHIEGSEQSENRLEAFIEMLR